MRFYIEKICKFFLKLRCNILKQFFVLFFIWISILCILVILQLVDELVLMSLLAVPVVYCIVFPYLGKYYCDQVFKKERDKKNNSNDKYYAVVLISNAQSIPPINNHVIRYCKNIKAIHKNSLINSSAPSLYFFIKYFENRKIDYKLKQAITEKDIDDAVCDVNCQELYLIGHGSRGSFQTSEKKVYYSKYVDITIKKQIVSQLHCNHSTKEKHVSLTDILAINKTDSFLTEGSIMFLDVLCYSYILSRKPKSLIENQ